MKNKPKKHVSFGVSLGVIVFLLVFGIDIFIVGFGVYNIFIVGLISFIIGFISGVCGFLYSFQKKMKSIKPLFFIIVFLFLLVFVVLEYPFVQYNKVSKSNDNVQISIGRIAVLESEVDSGDVEISIG